MKTAIALLLCLLSAGCTHAPPAELKATPGPPPPRFALTYTAGRQGEIEPCGCHLRPLGGVDRELNARASMRRDGVSEWALASGPQFVPSGPLPARDYTLRKASYLVDALNALGIQVMAADARDFSFGREAFESLLRNSRSQWISANLYAGGRALFPSFTTRVFGGRPVQVFGASGCSQAPTTVECREPVAALKKALAGARPLGLVGQSDLSGTLSEPPTMARSKTTGPLVVLLASLDDEEVSRVLREIPEIAIVLNSPSGSALPGVVEEAGHRWLASPAPRGRALVRMEIPGDAVAQATSEMVWIDAAFAEPVNPLRALIEKWKSAQHDAAINGKP